MDNSKANYTNPPISKVQSTVPRLSKLLDATKEKISDLKKDSTTTSPIKASTKDATSSSADNKGTKSVEKTDSASKTSPSSISNVPPPKSITVPTKK